MTADTVAAQGKGCQGDCHVNPDRYATRRRRRDGEQQFSDHS
jgi:hypothetical protein